VRGDRNLAVEVRGFKKSKAIFNYLYEKTYGAAACYPTTKGLREEKGIGKETMQEMFRW